MFEENMPTFTVYLYISVSLSVLKWQSMVPVMYLEIPRLQPSQTIHHASFSLYNIYMERERKREREREIAFYRNQSS